MRYLAFLLLLLSQQSGFAQTTYQKFQWQARPTIQKVSKEFENEAAVYMIDERINEYIVEKDGLYFYHTVHKIVHINNDKGIENFNKIYLPSGEGVTMVDVKARTILPDGKIIELDKQNIKDLKEDDNEYKIFAMDGLTKGCDVEYYFTLRQEPSFFGREVIGSGLPVAKARFELITPAFLLFETKSFNQLPESKLSEEQEKRHHIIEDQNIAGMEEEGYSMYRASLKRVEFKLCYNKSRDPKNRLFTWNELAKKLHDIYTGINDKEKKKVRELLEETGAQGTDVQKATAIENYLKKNFITREDIPGDDSEDLIKVIKVKMASTKAMGKLFVTLFKEAGINFQIVLAGDRSDYLVDRNFENWNATKNFLLYLPSAKKFLAPTEMQYRYPWIPPTWAATNGLFCVTTTIGDFTTAVAEVKPIAMEDPALSFVNLDVTLRMEKEDTLVLGVKQLYGGYAASNYRLPFNFMPADQQRDILKQMVKFGTNSENILSHSFENKEMESDPYKPFVINATVKSANLVEKAGDKLLVKIGELIGEQSQLYDEKERKTDIDVSFPHVLERSITFTLPEGYQPKNLSDLVISEVYKENDKETMGFSCNYTINGRELKITIRETYNRVIYPKAQYSQFKKVINAAADFNKVVLVLAKA
ncbi:MAG TPA: DUF3857 domain-containing protein [Flavisolibacter sp.]|nr:DUF3857 domain-containing protein [Flavisolibacter sp.]